MARSPCYEAHIIAAWRDLLASVDALRAELKTAPRAAHRGALAAVARALRVKGLKRLLLVNPILRELKKAATGTRAA